MDHDVAQLVESWVTEFERDAEPDGTPESNHEPQLPVTSSGLFYTFTDSIGGSVSLEQHDGRFQHRGTVAVRADKQSFVGINPAKRAAKRESRDLPGGFGVDMGGINDRLGILTSRVINLPALAPNLHAAAAAGGVLGAGDNHVELARLKVDRGQSARGGDDQFVALGSISILVEIKAGAARLSRKADHPVACGRVNPVARRLFGRDSTTRHAE